MSPDLSLRIEGINVEEIQNCRKERRTKSPKRRSTRRESNSAADSGSFADSPPMGWSRSPLQPDGFDLLGRDTPKSISGNSGFFNLLSRPYMGHEFRSRTNRPSITGKNSPTFGAWPPEAVVYLADVQNTSGTTERNDVRIQLTLSIRHILFSHSVVVTFYLLSFISPPAYSAGWLRLPSLPPMPPL